MPFVQYLTFFVDDTTTIDGATVPGIPTVAQTSCSTDPTHARPAMMLVEEGVDTEINLIESSVAIGAMVFRVQDNRTVAADQTTGWFTAKLADAGGKNQLIGQRVNFMQIDQFGTVLSIDLLVQDMSLESNKTVYKIPTRDMRERERTMGLFYRSEETVIWPSALLDAHANSGVRDGYGRVTPTGTTFALKQPSVGVKATWQLNIDDAAAPFGRFYFDERPFVDLDPPSPLDWNVLFLRYNIWTDGVVDPATAPTALGSTKTTGVMTGTTVQWRPEGSTGAWTTLRYAPMWNLATGNSGNWQRQILGWIWGGTKSNRITQREVIGYGVAWHDFTLLPANNQRVEVRFLSGLPPAEDHPFYFEGTFGQFLKNCYDGLYSLDPTGIRYDATVMADLVANSPLLRLIKTSTEKEALSWLETNWYQVMRMFPLVNEKGEIVPTSWELPDSTATITVLDTTNVIEADWKHGSDDAVTGVEFTYQRDFVDRDGNLQSVDVHVDKINAAGTVALGSKIQSFSPETVRDLTSNLAESYGKAAATELGYAFAQQISAALLDRFSLGGQHVTGKVLRTDVNVRNLKVGMWCQVSVPWLPDYQTKKRGINRLMQVVKIKDVDLLERDIELVDAGPFAQPLVAPLNTTVTPTLIGQRLQFSVTGIPLNTYRRVDIAQSATLPGPTSPAWVMAGRVRGSAGITSGTINMANLPGGLTFIRIRDEKEGTRPSGWVQDGSVTVPIALVAEMSQQLLPDGRVKMSWPVTPGILGLRIYYIVKNPLEATTSPTVFVDVDATLGTYTFPAGTLTLKQYFRLITDIVPYPGFAAGAVSGTPGTTTRLTELSKVDETVITPELKVATSEGPLTGFANLTLYDPSNVIHSVETQTYSGLILIHDWVPVTPSGLVYSDSVPLVEKQVSIINYRIRIWQPDGSLIYIDQKPIRYAIGSIPMTPTLKYEFGTDGTLTITATGDSDTNLIHIVVGINTGYPTPGDIDAATGVTNAFIGRFAQYVHPVKLKPNDRFYAAARSYNTNLGGTIDSQGSIIPDRQSDFYIPATAVATVQPGGGTSIMGLNSKQLTVNNIVFGPMTQSVRVFVREFKTDPGVAQDVSEKGYELPNSPLLVSGGSVTIPVANPGNYFHITLLALDTQNRIGAGVGVWDGVTQPAPIQGIVNIKTRAALAAQPAPADLSNLTVVTSGTDTAVLSMTMPGSNLPATLRIKRDGVAMPDIARTALAGAIQTFNDPGRSPGTTYSYQVFGVNASGIESPAGSVIRTVTFGQATIPTPTITIDPYSVSAQGYNVYITPGAGSPAGVVWQIERHSTQIAQGNVVGYDAYAPYESSTATTIFHSHPNYLGAGTRRDQVRVYGTKAGYNNSLTSNVATTPDYTR